GDAAGIRRLHVIAGVDQAQPDAAGDRRDYPAIGDVERLRVDEALVLFHRAGVLLHDEDLILGLLPRDRILLGQGVIALLVHLRLREQPLIARQLAFVLLLQIYVWPGIDLREKITLLDQLAFGESNFGQLAVDLGLHGHSGERRHRAELIE